MGAHILVVDDDPLLAAALRRPLAYEGFEVEVAVSGEEALGRALDHPPELVITNPPRTGMDVRVTEALERLRPERVVYISCDPATLARDLSRLPGFRLADAVAFDLFPQTAHVETVVVLERAS